MKIGKKEKRKKKCQAHNTSYDSFHGTILLVQKKKYRQNESTLMHFQRDAKIVKTTTQTHTNAVVYLSLGLGFV